MDVSTVVFAILAIFVVWKLRSVLGTRTGNERPPVNPFGRRKMDGTDQPADAGAARGNVVTLPGAAERVASPAGRPEPAASRWAGFAEPGSALASGFDQIRTADPSFEPKAFTEGARVAHEHIILGFAKGDRVALAALLAPDVLEGFTQAIAKREERGEVVETTFVGLDEAEIEDAQLKGSTAQIAMRFETKLISATRDRNGAVIEGDPERVSTVVDNWTFARDATSRDPNWRLVATGTGR